jgi:hypothetical protein
MTEKRTFLDVLLHFFPFQLLFWHLRKNIFALMGWGVLFLFISGGASKFGIPFLFYSPEYLGEVNLPAFLILGFGVGGYIMAFNLYSYIILGPIFPFIVTVTSPFLKFSLNNLIIPVLFIVLYGVKMISFQMNQEYATAWEATGYFLMFLLGIFTFIAISFFYFFRTNKDLFKLSGKTESEFRQELKAKPVGSALHKEVSWYKILSRIKDRRHYYFGLSLKIRKSRDWMHYDRALLEKVFAQNHINASIFEFFIIISFLIIGFFRESEYFVVPAAASIILIFSIVLMVISAIFSWIKTWTYFVMIVLFLGLNYFSKNKDFQQFNNYIYGINYTDEVLDYSETDLINMHTDIDRAYNDKVDYIETLNNWKAKTGQEKPKLIIVNTSGGGARSAMWTFLVLSELDSLTNGGFSQHVQMITGASGGMLGASYYRELLLRSKTDSTLNLKSIQFQQNIAKDLLNQVAFTISTNDLFYRYQSFHYKGIKYLKDRGYAFEQQLHVNTDYVLEKSLGDYRIPEKEGVIPVMVFSPTLVNDGRRLLISSQPTGFYQLNSLCMNSDYDPILENFEYNVLLKKYKPENTRFSSVLRMNATFPYVLPMVVLPGNMNFHVMDAGIRDNYGGKTTINYLSVFKDWIKENTSGVIIVRVRDLKKNKTGIGKRTVSMMEKLTLPFGNVYGNFPFVQDFNQDEMIALTFSNFDFPIDLISINLRETIKDKISLSWHLTTSEKAQVRNAINKTANQIEMEKIVDIIKK